MSSNISKVTSEYFRINAANMASDGDGNTMDEWISRAVRQHPLTFSRKDFMAMM